MVVFLPGMYTNPGSMEQSECIKQNKKKYIKQNAYAILRQHTSSHLETTIHRLGGMSGNQSEAESALGGFITAH